MSSKAKKAKAAAQAPVNPLAASKLYNALEAGLKPLCRPGMSALKGDHRNRLKLGGASPVASIDLDAAFKEAEPNSNRWDYLLEVSGQVYALEVHPSRESEATRVEKKAAWVRALIEQRPNVQAITYRPKQAVCYWISSGETYVLPTSPMARKLATKGIGVCGSGWSMPKPVV